MKLLVFCSILIIYFASPTAALICYECDDMHDKDMPTCRNEKIVSCGANTSQTYCGKGTYYEDEHFNWCIGNCNKKGCIPLENEYECEASNSYEVSDGMIFCCQGDLCNSSDKLSNQMNVLFCAVVFSCFHSLVAYLWN